jgi:hypothetical protein
MMICAVLSNPYLTSRTIMVPGTVTLDRREGFGHKQYIFMLTSFAQKCLFAKLCMAKHSRATPCFAHPFKTFPGCSPKTYEKTTLFASFLFVVLGRIRSRRIVAYTHYVRSRSLRPDPGSNPSRRVSQNISKQPRYSHGCFDYFVRREGFEPS